jgi:hypothetical protein
MLLSSLFLLGVFAALRETPPVRTITAFVAVEPESAEARLADAAQFLKSARAEFQKRGLTVQTIRVATTPMAASTAKLDDAAALALLARMDAIARRERFALSVGPVDARRWRLAAEAIRRTEAVSANLRLTDRESAVAAAELMRALSTQIADGSQNFRFAAIAGLAAGAPFFPGGYASREIDRSFAIGAESAGVIRDGALLLDAVQPMVSAAEAVARASGWRYLGLDTSPAPAPGNSIAAALEKRAGAPVGSPGTLAAAAAITAELKALPVKQTGFSGLMLPVLEDEVLAQRAAEGRFTLHSLLLYSAVCGTGLDTVPIPGDTPITTVAVLLEEVALLAKRWSKPLSARLFLVPGKKAGDRVTWDRPHLVNSYRVMDVGSR